MKNILVIGAGRSASSLIQYLLSKSAGLGWKVTVADYSLQLALQKVNGHPNGKALAFDVNNDEQRRAEISAASLVISMLPASMHYMVAEDCIELGRSMVTASYVSKEIRELDVRARAAGVLLLNEIGLDPGIDHMSAMQIINQIKSEGASLVSFKSYCGGLVAPESNDNPWGYKFTWNPRNVILAGQGTAQYLHEGKKKHLPYNRLFTEVENVSIPGHGMFEAYANRDSLSYEVPYGLTGIGTLLRGTLRMPGYCEAWNSFVKLGITDDSYLVEDSGSITYREFIESYLPWGSESLSLRKRLADFLAIDEHSDIIGKIEWLGILGDKKIGIEKASPARILQHLLEEKWKLNGGDKDMIVMQHQFVYEVSGMRKRLHSSMVVMGEDEVYTAMAKTVGLPVAIAAKLILTGQIEMKGVQIPTEKNIYGPVLEELKEYGVVFEEEIIS